MSRTLLVTGFLLAATAVAEAQSRRDESYESRIDTTLAFDRRGSVILSAGSGEIVVTGWNRDQVRVRAWSERSTIRMDASSSRISLDLSRARGGDTRYEVTVPIGVRVSARSTSGDISITGTKGSVDANTNTGDLTVEDVAETVDLRSMSGDISGRTITGNVEVSTLNGDLMLTDVRGDVEASSVSGEIDLRNVTAKYVRAKTTSGDVTYDGTVDAAGRYELGSHSGSVYLTIPQATGALVTIATYSGSIESPDFPITLRPGEHGIGASKRFTFEVGKGDARISAESFSGDITIRSKGAGRRPE
jgi:DUF4097 and DUF4098 domain-containing protein YvlB